MLSVIVSFFSTFIYYVVTITSHVMVTKCLEITFIL